MLKSYDFVTPGTLAYFSQRPPQAERIRGLPSTMSTRKRKPPRRKRVLAALESKCDVLWAMLDALSHAYVAPQQVPPVLSCRGGSEARERTGRSAIAADARPRLPRGGGSCTTRPKAAGYCRPGARVQGRRDLRRGAQMMHRRRNIGGDRRRAGDSLLGAARTCARRCDGVRAPRRQAPLELWHALSAGLVPASARLGPWMAGTLPDGRTRSASRP